MWRGERSRGISDCVTILRGSVHRTNRHSHQGNSGLFVPKRDKYLSGTCFKMVGARPSMSFTFDGYGIWPKTKWGVCEKCVVPGNGHRCTRGVERREVVDLPLNKPEGLNLRTRLSFLANFFVEPFIVVVKQKRPRKCGMWHKKSGATRCNLFSATCFQRCAVREHSLNSAKTVLLCIDIFDGILEMMQLLWSEFCKCLDTKATPMGY